MQGQNWISQTTANVLHEIVETECKHRSERFCRHFILLLRRKPTDLIMDVPDLIYKGRVGLEMLQK